MTHNQHPASLPPPTEEQAHFLEIVSNTDGHVLLQSTAGSGKTRCLIDAAWRLPTPERSLYLAYNKQATQNLPRPLPRGMQARTVHATGFLMLRRTGRDPQLNDHKTALLLERLSYTRPESADLSEVLKQAWNIYREEFLRPEPQHLGGLAHTLNWNAFCPEGRAPSDWERHLSTLLGDLETLSVKAWQEERLIDYTDMLWLCCRLGVFNLKVDCAVVDEGQDFTRLRTEFVLRLTGHYSKTPGRIIAAGDLEQEIYAYSMQERSSLWNVLRQQQAHECSLSLSFRCPKTHVELARLVSSLIHAAPTNRAGQVLHVQAQASALEGPTTILSRNNAGLLRFAHHLHQSGRPSSLRDGGLCQQLTQALSRMPEHISTGDFSAELAHLSPLLGEHLNETVTQIAQDYARDGTIHRRYLTTHLRNLTHPDSPSTDLFLTIHRAKGREWADVTLLYPEELSLNAAGDDPEACVTFVGLTRSTHVLRLAYHPRYWFTGRRLGQEEQPDAEIPDQQQDSGTSPPARPTFTPPVALVPGTDCQTQLDSPFPEISGTVPIRTGQLYKSLQNILQITRRPPLRERLTQMMRQLSSYNERHYIGHDPESLKQLLQAVRASRLAIPDPQHPAAPNTVRVIYPRGSKAGMYIGHLPVISESRSKVTVQHGEEQLTFHLKHGELYGRRFNLAAPHLYAPRHGEHD